MRDIACPTINLPVDVSKIFAELENAWFLAGETTSIDADEASGCINWKRYQRKPRMAFNQICAPLESVQAWEFPPEYEEHPTLPFSLEFISDRVVRLRIRTRRDIAPDIDSPMLVGPLGASEEWTREASETGVVWKSPAGSVRLSIKPWRLEFFDVQGRLLTGTQSFGDSKCIQNADPTPFAFIRRAGDLRRCIAATFSLAPDEKIFGCGESFTRLNKRGQKVVLWTNDAHGVQTGEMYKPIPFFMSSRGYGMFVHSSAPMSFDFGCAYDSATTLYVGDEALDLFIFLGDPKEILSEYTALTGRSPMPPLWSFGLWMSRITYKSEAETREVADSLRSHQIPCDVIHLDTGWFEKDWQCDFKFSTTRFGDPVQLIQDLRKQGIRVSLWQLPYFTPTNSLYAEAVAKGYVVRNGYGTPATEDAIVDFSNPEAVSWYQGLLEKLLRLGVSAIKVDFGEGAPREGLYASGSTGWTEHNLYPLRYNCAVAEVTRRVHGEDIIWARSAWAGSQRYPIHWGGDAENIDCGMAASLRGGLSFGLSGFSFWSHDIGGFTHSPTEPLYRRWMPFGMLTSHSRCHGSPPKEPWHFSAEFQEDFRRSVELKYRLMPYVWAQSKICSENGWPLLRSLFFEYPEDPGSWLVEDEYFFGRDLLVAPLMENTAKRPVYLPPGIWIDYQTGRQHEGGRWVEIEAGEIPCVILVRNGAVIPHIELAQSTDFLDWSKLKLNVYSVNAGSGVGFIFLPGDESLHQIEVLRENGESKLVQDPLAGKVTWEIAQKVS